MSDAEVLSDVLSSLQALFPGTYREPLAHAITRWGQVWLAGCRAGWRAGWLAGWLAVAGRDCVPPGSLSLLWSSLPTHQPTPGPACLALPVSAPMMPAGPLLPWSLLLRAGRRQESIFRLALLPRCPAAVAAAAPSPPPLVLACCCFFQLSIHMIKPACVSAACLRAVSGDAAADARAPEEGGRQVALRTRLWFAGEATSAEDAYTVHGAFHTGSASQHPRTWPCWVAR